jgi:hypothetical protein
MEQLTAIWLGAADRNAVTVASDRIDRLLQSDPHAQGESRAENERFWIERPLAVTFEIRDAERKVIVKTFRPARSRH